MAFSLFQTVLISNATIANLISRPEWQPVGANLVLLVLPGTHRPDTHTSLQASSGAWQGAERVTVAPPKSVLHLWDLAFVQRQVILESVFPRGLSTLSAERDKIDNQEIAKARCPG